MLRLFKEAWLEWLTLSASTNFVQVFLAILYGQQKCMFGNTKLRIIGIVCTLLIQFLDLTRSRNKEGSYEQWLEC